MQFTADLVETHAEKLAYIDFHRFINKRLVEVEFADKIIECCARRNNDA